MTRSTLRYRLFLLGILVGGALGAGLEERPCTVHSENGDFYDLNPLSANKDYEINTPGGHYIILNVCRPVKAETWNLKVDDPKDVAGFIRRDHGDFSIGKANTTLAIEPNTDGPKLTMRGGSRCTSNSGATQGSAAETTISFMCDTKVFGAGTPQLRNQFPSDEDEACSWYIEWKTHYACPRGERGGIWGFFTFLVIILLIILALYTTLGTLYNRYVLKLRGFDQVPQFSIEGARYHVMEMWEVAKDADWKEVLGNVSTVVGERIGMVVGWFTRGGSGSGYGGGYGRLPTDASGLGPEEGRGGFRRPLPRRGPTNTNTNTNSFSHQAQVDVGSGGGGRGTPVPTSLPGGGVGGVGGRGQSQQATNTNPVSHFSQTQQNQNQASTGTLPPSRTNPNPTLMSTGGQIQGQDGRGDESDNMERELAPIRKKPMTGDVNATKEERTAFLLEDEEDDEEGDIVLGDNTTKPIPAQSQSPSQTQQDTQFHSESQGPIPDQMQDNETARMRGRDLTEEGGEGFIRL